MHLTDVPTDRLVDSFVVHHIDARPPYELKGHELKGRDTRQSCARSLVCSQDMEVMDVRLALAFIQLRRILCIHEYHSPTVATVQPCKCATVATVATVQPCNLFARATVHC